MLPVCIKSSNFKSEDIATSDCFCDFYTFSKHEVANVALFLWNVCQVQKRLVAYELDIGIVFMTW